MRPAFCHSWYRAICALTVLLIACDGGSGGGGGPTGPSGPLTLQPARSEYATFENARVTVRGASLTSGSYAGTLGGASVSAQRTSDSTVVFQVPDLTAGSYTLTLEIGRRSATTQLGVRATPPIEDPVAYVATVDSVFLHEVEELEDWYAKADPSIERFLDAQGFAADLAMMRATLAELRADFRALSAADQQKVAMTVQAFRAADAASSAAQFARLASADDEEEYFPQCQFPEVETAEEMRACQRQHRGEMINRAKTVEQCNIDFDAQWEEGRYADAVGRNYIAYQCLKARMLKLKRDVAETVRSTVIGWFSHNTANAQALALFDHQLDPYYYTFVSGASFPHFTPPLTFRNMHAEDVGRLPAATELGELMQSYQEAWDELNEMFPRPFQQSPPWLHQLYERHDVGLPYDPASLSLGRVEPASVTGSAEVVDGKWALTFSAPASTTEPTFGFSFETIVDNAEFGADTIVVHSELLVHPLGGTWDAQMSLEVSEWLARHDGSRYERAGRCTGTVELVGERFNYGYPVHADSLRFGSNNRLICEEYDGITNEILAVNMNWVYAPGNGWVGEGASEIGSLEVDGQNVRISGVLTGACCNTVSTSISATLVDGRLEGTYERIDDSGTEGRLKISGTFVAVKRR